MVHRYLDVLLHDVDFFINIISLNSPYPLLCIMTLNYLGDVIFYETVSNSYLFAMIKL
jgi:hypothetical protein